MQRVGLLKICVLNIKLTFLCFHPSDLTTLSTIGYLHKGYTDNSSAHNRQMTALHKQQQSPEVCSCKHCFRWKFEYDWLYGHYTWDMKVHTGCYSHWHRKIDEWSVLILHNLTTSYNSILLMSTGHMGTERFWTMQQWCFIPCTA